MELGAAGILGGGLGVLRGTQDFRGGISNVREGSSGWGRALEGTQWGLLG